MISIVYISWVNHKAKRPMLWLCSSKRCARRSVASTSRVYTRQPPLRLARWHIPRSPQSRPPRPLTDMHHFLTTSMRNVDPSISYRTIQLRIDFTLLIRLLHSAVLVRLFLYFGTYQERAVVTMCTRSLRRGSSLSMLIDAGTIVKVLLVKRNCDKSEVLLASLCTLFDPSSHAYQCGGHCMLTREVTLTWLRHEDNQGR